MPDRRGRSSRQGHRGRPAFSAALVMVAVWTACAPEAPSRPPLLLVTVEGLRADLAVTALPRTAEAFAAAGCRRTAIATSSAAAPAVASVITGLSPWRHRVLLSRQTLAPEFRTLAEALQAGGYQNRAWSEASATPSVAKGFAQGIDQWSHFRDGREPSLALRGLAAGQFVWIHLGVAVAFLKADPGDPALAKLNGEWQRRARRGLRRSDLQAAAIRGAMTPELAEVARNAYLGALGALDQKLSPLFRALNESPANRRATAVLIGIDGEPLGADGEWQRGHDLGRASIEVPFWYRAPDLDGSPCADSTTPPSASGAFALLLDRAGLSPPPGVATVQRGKDNSPSFSELYRLDGANRFSWVTEGQQIQWRTSLAPAGAGRRRLGKQRDRLDRQVFPRLAPLSGTGGGGSAVTTQVTSWAAGAGPPGARAASADERARFRAAFLGFVDRERAPLYELAEVP